MLIYLKPLRQLDVYDDRKIIEDQAIQHLWSNERDAMDLSLPLFLPNLPVGEIPDIVTWVSGSYL